jgi:hypothetical protein
MQLLEVNYLNTLLYLIIGNVIISYMMSFGGWKQLTQNYKANTSFVGARLNFQTAIINTGKQSGTINVGINSSGLHLSCIFFLRPGHPPLFIPWSEISWTRERERYPYAIKLQTAKQPGIPILITESLFEEIKALSGQ